MSDAPDDASQRRPEDEYEVELTNDARNWAMFCHLAALFVFGAPPVGHVLGPLLVWLLKRNDHPFIDEHGKESVNFQISVTIYTLLLLPLCCALIGIPLIIALWVTNVVLVIMAAVKASNGEPYRYPLTIRLVH